MSSVVSKVAERLPRKLFVRLVALQYPLFEPELRCLHQFVPDDKVAIDIGTWWGPWSWWLARRAPRVEAFEPNGSIYESLQHALPSNVVLHNVALSDRNGASVLWSPDRELGTEGRSTLTATGHPGWVHQDVMTASLDSFGFANVGFVKIDVEGHELAVLRGAGTLLATQRPNVLVEVEQAHQSADQFDDVLALMLDAGYQGSFLKDRVWRPLSALDRDAVRVRGETEQSRGMLRNTLTRDRYIHNFLFSPRESPGPSPGLA
jgi:FkbM family methyltransferase